MPAKASSTYRVTTCSYTELNRGEQHRCLDILRHGDAVDVDSAARELPVAEAVVLARLDQKIVGLGAVKRLRPDYAVSLAKKAGVAEQPLGHEVGYIAVDEAHWGHKLGLTILLELLAGLRGPAHATTDQENMKNALRAAGFNEVGQKWRGARADLSLWIKTA